jgi:LysR family glycine cleavage system transcriptional activator
VASRLQQPSDLEGELFLHDARWTQHWQQWLSVAVPERDIDATGPTFSLYSLALQEAQNGAGVLMGHEPLVRSSLNDGSLVAPFEQIVKLSRKLVIVTPQRPRKGSVLEKIIALLESRS